MNFGKCVSPLGLLVILCLVFCRLTQADLLVLNNGDRITGVIKRIWDREISIEPEYSDEFNVDISVVDYIESDRVFEIDFGDGQSMLASFAGADADVICDAASTATLQFELPSKASRPRGRGLHGVLYLRIEAQ